MKLRFRSGYSTSDHTFALYSLIEILQDRKINCYALSLTFVKLLIRFGD